MGCTFSAPPLSTPPPTLPAAALSTGSYYITVTPAGVVNPAAPVAAAAPAAPAKENAAAAFAQREGLVVQEREVLGKLVLYCIFYVGILLSILAVFLGVIDRARCKYKWISFVIGIVVALLNLVLIGYQMILYARVLFEMDEQAQGLRRNIISGLRIMCGVAAYLMLMVIASSVLVGVWKIQCDRTIQH